MGVGWKRRLEREKNNVLGRGNRRKDDCKKVIEREETERARERERGDGEVTNIIPDM